MSSPSADRHLLFGLLALQNGLVSHEQLVAAFSKWTSDKSVSLDDVLVADGSLQPETCTALQHMVELHVERHGGDARQSLMILPGSDWSTARRDLEALDDSDLHKSIAQLPEPDAFVTAARSIGTTTSEDGRFRILRPLEGARGGMGVISVARDEELGRQVALKQIRSDKADHEGFRQKFQVEAEITGNLEHPGIVPIYGLGTGADGRPYYAMRLVEGDDMNKTIRHFHEKRAAGSADYNSVEFRGLIDRLIDVAQAIRYAHSRGVLHRDLKPGNILVGKYGETLVIDWGLARLPQDHPRANQQSVMATGEGLDQPAPLEVRSGSDMAATFQGSMMGTVGYAPPEQVSGRIDLINERSDVYALGAILYQILAGRAPIEAADKGGDLSAMMEDTIQGRITAPREVLSSIPKPLSAVCMKSLSREPADRYETAEELIAELERWRADQPVAAAPDSIPDRVMRLARRYRAAALAATAALVGIAVVTGVALVVVNRARVNEAVAAQRNQTVVDSFVAAFRSADPENEGVTGSMTALEVLQQALARMEDDDELQNHPLTKATLLDATGTSLESLGAYDMAISSHESSRDLRKAQLGPNHPDTLTSMNNLANAYRSAGRLNEAIPLYEETLQLRKAKLEPKHPDTLSSMNNLAVAYQNAGRLDEALPLYEETLKLRKIKLGPKHPQTLESMNNLAVGYKGTGRPDEALPLYEETLQLMEAKLGDEHPDTLASRDNLAVAYQEAGRLDEALPLYEETLKLRKIKLGPKHPWTLRSMNSLARGYRDAGRLDEALPLFEETLRLTKAKLGDEHPHTLTSMNNLAGGYRVAGRLAEALPLLEETLRLEKAKLGDEHPSTLTSMNNLAMCYEDAGRLEEALPLYEETLRLRRTQLGDERIRTLTSMNNLAMGYRAAGRLEEALPLLEETLRLLKAKLGEEHPHTLSSMNNVALGYQDAGRLEEALPLLEETLRLTKAKRGSDHPETLTSMHNLADGYRVTGRLEEALPLFKDTLKLRQAKLGSEHPDTLKTTRAIQEASLPAGQLERRKESPKNGSTSSGDPHL